MARISFFEISVPKINWFVFPKNLSLVRALPSNSNIFKASCVRPIIGLSRWKNTLYILIHPAFELRSNQLKVTEYTSSHRLVVHHWNGSKRPCEKIGSDQS